MTQATVVNYEIVWGDDESDRILYADSGDGSWLSTDARVRADRKYFELCEAGASVGYYVDGALRYGVAV